MANKKGPLFIEEDLIKARERILNDIQMMDDGIDKFIELKHQLQQELEIIKHLQAINQIFAPKENHEEQAG